MQLLQRPPHGLDVLGVHRPVRVVEVDPHADPLGQPLPVVRRTACTDSRQRRLNSATPKASMSRLPVVPISFSTSSSTGRPWQSQPPFRGDVVPGHRLEPRVDVLERARLHVVDARLPVRRGRALVEDPGGARPRAGRSSARTRRPVLPERQDAALELREAHLGVHRLEPRHLVPSSTRPDMENAPSHPMPGRGVGPAVPPRLPPVSRPVTALGPPARSSAMTGGTRLRLLRCAGHRRPFRAGARGG